MNISSGTGGKVNKDEEDDYQDNMDLGEMAKEMML